MKIINYAIITYATSTAVFNKVKELISEGWEPQGGISYSPTGQPTQAMVLVDRSIENQVAEQINDIHSGIVIDMANFIQTWWEYQSYPRQVTETKR